MSALHVLNTYLRRSYTYISDITLRTRANNHKLIPYLEAGNEVLEREEVVLPAGHGCGAQHILHLGEDAAGRLHQGVVQLDVQPRVVTTHHVRLKESGGRLEQDLLLTLSSDHCFAKT